MKKKTAVPKEVSAPLAPESPKPAPKSVTLRFWVPLSIVLAGMLVAAAIVFVGTYNKQVAGTATTTTGNTTAPAKTNDLLPAKLNFPPVTANDHIRGDVDAAVKIVEYSDFECPFCKRFHTTLSTIIDNYDGDVAWVFRNFPLESLHQQAPKEAEAGECVAKLGGNEAFWKFHDIVFTETQSNDGLDLAQLPTYAKQAGVDAAAFTSCLDSGEMKVVVDKQYQDAVTAGGTGTPYSIIIGPTGETIPVTGAQSAGVLTRIIDEQLKKAK